VREFNGRGYLLETALTADFSLIKAWKADRFGNLTYRKTAENFNPMMAAAGKITIAEVEEIADVLSPLEIMTPGIYVQRVILGNHEKRIERLTARRRTA
jgi:3-oxoacid CoA-transferase subunit A